MKTEERKMIEASMGETPKKKNRMNENTAPRNAWYLGNILSYCFSIILIKSAKAGRVIKTPAVIPISEVIAKPCNKPAPAAPIPRNPTAPVSGTRETNAVANDVKIMNNAFLIFTARDSAFPLDSSRITIWESTPVPIVAIIPAIEGRSRFHFIRAAIPRMIISSEKDVTSKAKEIRIFRYLMKIIKETARIANNPPVKTSFINASPRTGEIRSILTIFNLKGRLPVFIMV